MKKKICVITGTRAEYGLLYWVMKAIKEDAELELQVVATGMHLSSKFGLTYKVIEEDGFNIDQKIEIPLDSDTAVNITKSVGIAISGFAESFATLRPDMIILLGDRFEIIAAATAATIARVPIAHIHGGELTEGAFDDSFRHAITKMSFLHFASAEPYRQRIIQMGESPNRVFCVGATGIENINKLSLLSRDDLEESLRFKIDRPTFLVTYHPVTLDNRISEIHIKELLGALDSFPNAKILFTGVNADPDNISIEKSIHDYVQKNSKKAILFTSLGQLRYLSAVKHSDVVIGNSSSGIIEVPTFKIPTVNIGDRQKGRIKATSVVDCDLNKDSIIEAIERATSREFRESCKNVDNPYGDGNSSEKIIAILKKNISKIKSLKKTFYDIDAGNNN